MMVLFSRPVSLRAATTRPTESSRAETMPSNAKIMTTGCRMENDDDDDEEL